MKAALLCGPYVGLFAILVILGGVCFSAYGYRPDRHIEVSTLTGSNKITANDPFPPVQAGDASRQIK
jgi:hypothetical protein